MKKGISPIVAVVLLIAIAVIAAVGLYFWVGGLATKQPTPNTPIVLNAQSVTCGNGNGTNVVAMVQNLHPSQTMTGVLMLMAHNGTCYGELDGANLTTAVTIAAGSQKAVTFDCLYNVTVGDGDQNVSHWAGDTYIILGPAGVSQAQMVC